MALLKAKEIRKLNKEDKEKKIIELKLELIKSKGKIQQGGKNKIREIKKAIARLHTIK